MRRFRYIAITAVMLFGLAACGNSESAETTTETVAVATEKMTTEAKTEEKTTEKKTEEKTTEKKTEEKTTEKKTEEIKALYRAYNKAVAYLNNTPREEYIDLVIEKGGFPPVAKDALKLPKYHEAALPKESDVVDCVKWLQGKGLIQKNYTYADFVVDVLSK